MKQRTRYVLDRTGWDDPTLLEAVARALTIVREGATSAETDMPWSEFANWPHEVQEAATRLRDRHIRVDQRHQDYLQTGVVDPLDDQDRDDFLTFAPHALDATIWGDDGLLAELADEGTSLVIALTDLQAQTLASAFGPGHLMTLETWAERQPSIRRSLSRWWRRGTGPGTS